MFLYFSQQFWLWTLKTHELDTQLAAKSLLALLDREPKSQGTS